MARASRPIINPPSFRNPEFANKIQIQTSAAKRIIFMMSNKNKNSRANIQAIQEAYHQAVTFHFASQIKKWDKEKVDRITETRNKKCHRKDES